MRPNDIRRKMRIFYLAGMLTLLGFFVLYAIFALPNAENYPNVRITSAMFSFFSIVSGAGIFMRQRWVGWTLLCLLLSMYGVFVAIHFAVDETPQMLSVIAFVLLPVVAFLFWRVVRRFVFEE